MMNRWRVVVVCLGAAVIVQGCAQVLGFDEPREFDVAAGGGGGAVGGVGGAGGGGGGAVGGGGGAVGGGGGAQVQCASPSECAGEDDACNTRTCVEGTCGVMFSNAGTPCGSGFACDGAGACKKDVGTVCAGGEECSTGFCVDGVCCDAACTGTCEACSSDLAGQGTSGICGPVKAGLDPDTDCAITTCNGASGCKLDNGMACAGGVECFSGNCVEGLCCYAACAIGGSCATGQCTCPGTTPQICSGVCKDLATDDENCGACGQTCAADATGINTCSNGVCSNRSWAAWPMPNPATTGLPNPSNYTIDEPNALVTDNVTKLMWQRNLDSGRYTWAGAKKYCAELVYGGHTDWRLPTRIELVSLVDFTKPPPLPTFDTTAFLDPPGSRFWTSSPLAGSGDSYAWYVSFDYGPTDYDGVSDMYMYWVRCVR